MNLSAIEPRPKARKISDETIRVMKTLHTFRATPYLVQDNLWAIGYGHTRTVRANSVITEPMAEQLLRDDMRLYGRLLERAVAVPLNDNQFGALVIFCAHVTPLKFESSPLLKLLNKGWYEQVTAHLRRWSKGQGDLQKSRRAAEIALWNSPCESVPEDGYTDSIA